MTNNELKAILAEKVDEDTLARIIVLEGDEFADGVIGLSDDNRLVYSFNRLVSSFMKLYSDEEFDATEEDAASWIDYNTCRTLDGMTVDGYLPPIIVNDLPGLSFPMRILSE